MRPALKKIIYIWQFLKTILYFLYWVSAWLVALPIVLAPTRNLMDLRWTPWPLSLSEVDNESVALRTPLTSRGPSCPQHRQRGAQYLLFFVVRK